jgi:hypothetical protein
MTRFTVAGLLFIGSALFHAFALTWPSISVAETPETHLLFVLVNLWLTNECSEINQSFAPHARVERFYVALAALSLHQVVVHGWLWWQAAHAAPPHLDYQSLGVVTGMGVIWALVAPRRQ